MPDISTTVSSIVHYSKMGDGPALVLLHGFPESSSLWRGIQDQLAEVYTLIMPDFPGSGGSLLEQATSISQMADIVAAIMDNENIEKAIVAGHSMGGYVGFAFAGKYPQRLAGLSLIHSTPVADDDEKIRTRQKAIDLIENGGKSAFIRQMVPNLFSGAFKESNPKAVESQVGMALQLDEKSLVNYYRAMIRRSDHTALLKNAVFPLQWIIGMDDNVIVYKKILQHCAISGINFVTFYHNCGHMSMIEAPDQLIGDLKEFAGYCYRQPKCLV